MRTLMPARLLTAALAVLLAVLLVACGESTDGREAEASDDAATSLPAETAEPAPEGGLPDWAPEIITDDAGDVTGLAFTDTPEPSDELLVEQVTTGDGPEVESGQTITAHYFGQLPDQDVPFDESFSGEPFQAPIGVGQLIQGWDMALVGVPVGSRVIMSVPSDLGYGDQGFPPTIPGGATLFFVIDVIAAD